MDVRHGRRGCCYIVRELKQHDIARTITLGGNTFMIRPFPAFVAANISGELGGVIAPVLAGALPLVAGGKADALNLDVGSFSGALASLSGDKVESVLKKLLIRHNNIAVQFAGEAEVVPFDNDTANELFCGSAQDMFILAYEVVQANFSGFFEKFGDLFGVRKSAVTTQKTA
jgi:hypothetical protein